MTTPPDWQWLTRDYDRGTTPRSRPRRNPGRGSHHDRHPGHWLPVKTTRPTRGRRVPNLPTLDDYDGSWRTDA